MVPSNCFILSQDEVNLELNSKLFGYAITKDALIFGSKGWNDYQSKNPDFTAPEEGRFCGVFVKGKMAEIKTDSTGQDILYVFQKGTSWIISNSFLLLAERASRKHSLSIHRPSVLGFHLKEGVHIGEQLISHKTMIDEISILPITSVIHLNLETKQIQIETKGFFEKFSFRPGETYEERVMEVLERGSGCLKALIDSKMGLNLHLSGGYDSRLVLGMLTSSGEISNTRVTSHTFKPDDYKVAKSLCNRFSLPLNTTGVKKRATLAPSESIRMYLLSCGGTYLPIYPVSSHIIQDEIEFKLTGDQPTGWSHFVGNARFNGDAAKIADDIEKYLGERDPENSVREEFLSTFDLLEVPSDHPAAMIAHYASIRSRHHCGRNWYKSLGNTFVFTPLMQSSFIMMDLHNLSNGHHPTKLFADTFSAFGNWALDEPFETQDRGFPEEYIKNSPFKGGIDIKPTKMKIYGKPNDSNSENLSDILSLPIDVDLGHDRIKSDLMTMFYRSNLAKNSSLFLPIDFARANGEIHAAGSLSHGHRKLTHIVNTEIVMRIVEQSGS